MPAPAQGVLAVECRTDDPVTAAQLGTLDHAPTRAAATTERGFLAALDAGCSTPVGALAEVAAETGAEPAVRVSGLIAAPDGSSVIRAHTTGAVGDGDALGRRLAHMLLKHGGAALLDRTSHGVTDPRSHPHPGDIDLAGETQAVHRKTAWLSRESGTVEKHVRSILTKLDLPESEADHRRVLAVLRFLEARLARLQRKFLLAAMRRRLIPGNLCTCRYGAYWSMTTRPSSRRRAFSLSEKA